MFEKCAGKKETKCLQFKIHFIGFERDKIIEIQECTFVCLDSGNSMLDSRLSWHSNRKKYTIKITQNCDTAQCNLRSKNI